MQTREGCTKKTASAEAMAEKRSDEAMVINQLIQGALGDAVVILLIPIVPKIIAFSCIYQTNVFPFFPDCQDQFGNQCIGQLQALSQVFFLKRAEHAAAKINAGCGKGNGLCGNAHIHGDALLGDDLRICQNNDVCSGTLIGFRALPFGQGHGPVKHREQLVAGGLLSDGEEAQGLFVCTGGRKARCIDQPDEGIPRDRDGCIEPPDGTALFDQLNHIHGSYKPGNSGGSPFFDIHQPHGKCINAHFPIAAGKYSINMDVVQFMSRKKRKFGFGRRGKIRDRESCR